MSTAHGRDEAMVDEFRRRLAMARVSLARSVARTDEELATLEKHQAGELAEDAGAVLVADVLARLEGQERHALDEIDAAQARLEAGVFGACERCHQPIPLVRLRVMPAARYCLACQAGLEGGA